MFAEAPLCLYYMLVRVSDLAYNEFLVVTYEHAVLACGFATAQVVKSGVGERFFFILVVHNAIDGRRRVGVYAAEHEHAVSRQSECELLVDVDCLALGETLQSCLVVERLCEDDLARDVSRNLQSLTQSESD